MKVFVLFESTASLLIVRKYSAGKATGLANIMGIVIKLLTAVKLLLSNTV